MAEIAKDSIEWKLHQDFWKLHKLFEEKKSSPEWCDKMLDVAIDFSQKYEGTELYDLANSISVAMIVMVGNRMRRERK
jgi:hypothetical protein